MAIANGYIPFCYVNSDEATRFYQDRYSNRRVPDRRMFQRIDECLNETGQLAPYNSKSS